jgi:hypothetical protein
MSTNQVEIKTVGEYRDLIKKKLPKAKTKVSNSQAEQFAELGVHAAKMATDFARSQIKRKK